MGEVRTITGDAGVPLTITPGDTATGIAATTYRQTIHGVVKLAIEALITCEDNTAKITFDGTTPTNEAGTDAGHEFAAGQSYQIKSIENIKNFLCVDNVSGSASKIKVTPFF
jgi:hypothetical protein